MSSTLEAPVSMTAIAGGTEDGITWATVNAPMFGAVNGYVKIPTGNVLAGLSYSEVQDRLDLDDLLGGARELTFGSDQWIGFDTLHSGDYWPEAPDHWRTDWSLDWTAELVADQTRALARKVAAARLARYVYVASSWRNPLQDSVVQTLRAHDVDCYDFKNPDGGTGFSWSQIDPNWQAWSAEEYVRLLDHPIAQAGYDSDFNAMERADAFVLVLPCGRSAHLELGWAVGKGKRTCILTRDGEEPELMAKMVDHIATSEQDLLAWLRVDTVDQPDGATR
ncbi:hypothetical protein QE370_000430 [Aeromicrobium sp. SORGH_AS981]|uniref:hypothetical protein n=1 Tax=Aeromicrobium sp. SORGH_AS_0981 TaxID=3041802 RepID=UPI002860948C|nr:hypothetical protein [Aeromicrobium sp. SORGH_AS_0981]MDR6117246.1 hypothetical protein [Aeromicrobium sp. SORGH_AS_0981]